MKKLTLPEMLASTLLFGLGLFTLARGLFWLREQESVLHDSEFYQAIHNILPIWAWGAMITVTSLFLIGSSWLLPKKNNMTSLFLFIGGTSNAVMYFLMTSASLFNAINWLSPAQFAVLSSVCALVGFFGGAELYARKKS
ncbi:hypothetical protein [Macrococcus bovicus]|uniref:hypothetical protein n=1 Tax=Macrococcus bovicus TaxID=69968 RepID=UPI0025A5C951|nr:hypothetical protein [Macrococcus bovicus]WJP97056.1 hypothetical protein QSV55_07160 [Macrococcus bovicus]